MTPAQVAAARRLADSSAAPSATRARPQPSGRPSGEAPLRVVPKARRRPARRRWAPWLCLLILLGTLMSVVLAHAYLAEAQVRMTNVQSELSAAQAKHESEELKVSKMETPSRINAAAQQEHLSAPGQITQVPHVPLNKPIPSPKVSTSTPTTAAAGG